MRIVIAGAGLVGGGLARRLCAGKHDVTVIDINREACERVYSQLGVSTICGSATSISTLEDAELNRAECAAAAMGNDSDNLCFCLLARHMGVPRIIARMRDPRYEEPYKVAGVTRVLNIVGLYINQFTWEIEQPEMQEVTALGQGKASIVFVKVPETSRAAGRTIAEIAQDERFPTDCVIVGILRSATGDYVVPRGHAAHTSTIREAVRFVGGA
jgi:trk system potassium uptake protein TrkA